MKATYFSFGGTTNVKSKFTQIPEFQKNSGIFVFCRQGKNSLPFSILFFDILILAIIQMVINVTNCL